MNRTNFKKSTLAVLIAGAMGFSGSLLAADKADASTPAKQPGAESPDKAHPAAKGEGKGPAGPAGKEGAAAADKGADASSAGGATGNSHWGKIDTDNDNLVTPDEMEKFLQAKHGSGAAGASAASGSKDSGAAGPSGDSGAKAASQDKGDKAGAAGKDMEKDKQAK